MVNHSTSGSSAGSQAADSTLGRPIRHGREERRRLRLEARRPRRSSWTMHDYHPAAARYIEAGAIPRHPAPQQEHGSREEGEQLALRCHRLPAGDGGGP